MADSEVEVVVMVGKNHHSYMIPMSDIPNNEENCEVIVIVGKQWHLHKVSTAKILSKENMVTGCESIPMMPQGVGYTSPASIIDRDNFMAVVVTGNHEPYRYMLSLSKVKTLEDGRKELPKGCYTSGYFERISDRDWSSLPELPDHLREQLDL